VQAHKHVTHNEAIRALDCLARLAIPDRGFVTSWPRQAAVSATSGANSTAGRDPTSLMPLPPTRMPGSTRGLQVKRPSHASSAQHFWRTAAASSTTARSPAPWVSRNASQQSIWPMNTSQWERRSAETKNSTRLTLLTNSASETSYCTLPRTNTTPASDTQTSGPNHAGQGLRREPTSAQPDL